MRKVINVLDGLTADYQQHSVQVQASRQQLRQQTADVETAAQKKAAEFRPADVGAQLRAVVLRTEGVQQDPDGLAASSRREQPPASSLQAAQQEFRQTEQAAREALQELTNAAQAWKRKTFRLSGSRPPVPQRLFDLTFRLSFLARSAPGLAEAYIANQVQNTPSLRAEAAERDRALLAALQQRAAHAQDDLNALRRTVGPGAQSWYDPMWSDAEVTTGLQHGIRIGELQPSLPSSAGDLFAPALVQFPPTTALALIAPVERRAKAIALARSTVLRLLATVPSRALRFVFIDPVALGQSVAEFRHLSEYDQNVVDVRTWTSERDIEARLEELSSHLETVISTYLRGQFSTIDEYNLHAGEVAEPYRILVVFDYPHSFNERSAHLLLSLIENGPRCGVHTLLLADPAREQPRNLPLDRLIHTAQLVDWRHATPALRLAAPLGDVAYPFVPDECPPLMFSADGRATTPYGELLTRAGRALAAGKDEHVTLDRLMPVLQRLIAVGRSTEIPTLLPAAVPADHDNPDTWWGATTAASTVAVLGRTGAQDVASLYFSSTEVAGGAIVIGVPRSGKSTALHAAITTMAMTYSPEELELYLVDSKHGVEFQAYVDLPHARVVSIHSAREFSVSVLTELQAKIAERATLMKERGHGATNITDFRTRTGEVLPRIVVVMDEFHEVFEDNDALSDRAFAAFSDIVRMGPFAGVHLVVATQTLSSTPSLDKATLLLLPTRVAFACGDADADLVMGDGNREVKALSKQGAGIVNRMRGDAAHNKAFQGLWIPVDERTHLLRAVRKKADAAGFVRTPRVFDGDRLAPRIPRKAGTNPSRPRIALGEPYGLEPSQDMVLRRRRGANLLVVGIIPDDDQHADVAALGALHSILCDAVQNGLAVQLIDFIGTDSDFASHISLEELCARLGVTYRRGGALPTTLVAVAETVQERSAAGQYHEAGVLVVLHGLHRARDLVPHDPYLSAGMPDFTLDIEEPAPADISVGSLLHTVLVEGPEVGVHVVVSVDGLTAFDSRLGSTTRPEFDLRLLGSGARLADVQTLTGQHNEAPVRSQQLLLAFADSESHHRMRGYAPFKPAELNHLED